jgi:hypothetical protein
MHMPRQRGIVGKDGVVPDHAVVRQMDIGHDPVVVAQYGLAKVTRGANVEGAELADGVAVTDVELAGLACILLVLRNGTQRVELEDPVVPPDGRVPFDHTMGADAGAGTDSDVRADDGVGTDGDGAVDLGSRINERCGMDAGHAHASGIRRWCAWCT